MFGRILTWFTFVLLTAVRSFTTVQWEPTLAVSMAKLDCCIFTATCRSTAVQRDVLFCFRSNNAYANALQCYVIRTVPVLFWIITANNKSRKRCVPFRYICGFQVMIIILHKHLNCVFCENVEGSPFSNLMLPYCSPLYHQCDCTITLPSITVGVSAPLISIQSS